MYMLQQKKKKKPKVLFWFPHFWFLQFGPSYFQKLTPLQPQIKEDEDNYQRLDEIWGFQGTKQIKHF